MNRPGVEAAAAGAMMVAPLCGCAAAGYAIGSLIGLAVPLGLLGLFAGLGVGMALVYARFRRI